MYRLSFAATLCIATLATTGIARAQADFNSCLAGIRATAAQQGVSGSTFDRVMAGVEPDPKVIESMNAQPEFKTPIWDYLATLVDEQKVAEGRQMMSRHAQALASAEQRFGVDRYAIAAVWGVESDYGKIAGRWMLPQSLATLTCSANRRQAYFRGELIATLKIVERGDIAPSKLRGSWAGAFGQTQFMPSTYLRLAVDGDGDGRRDLVDSTADALHSTANYLAKSGWVTGAGWGYEVQLPQGYSGPSGRTRKSPLAQWSALGIRRIDGAGLSGSGAAGLLLPAGANGPAFLVFKNYDAAYAYNGADSYALAISLLSDRLRGRGGIQAAWPTDDRGLSRAERKEVQEHLLRRGYDIGEADGAIGAKTRQAIADFQGRSGLQRDGRPGGRVLDALRGGR
ncbi:MULTISPECIES: lytic murein transglycosylase [unclassified Beijerinckia]|uniref:lytic murein transglycosylase n=1 Tax=unclassified Beijerinckia TaxID=2638183 RepID=UPI0008947F78|nr:MULTISPECIES: lytic murein transglycosylase [unclassified Beijerinckia]MDH7799441.1 lytic murein transglycosylase [Beijerinckia sp. GAS462]SED50555.1 lytic murein transglycosylase [Beijerinckia sp. 28-YEA-48]